MYSSFDNKSVFTFSASRMHVGSTVLIKSVTVCKVIDPILQAFRAFLLIARVEL